MSDAPAPAPTPAPTEAEAEVQTAVASAAAPPAVATGPAIDAWYVEHFNSLPIGWDTLMRNHVRAAVDDLKARLT